MSAEDAAELACTPYLAPLPAAQRTATLEAVMVSSGGGLFESPKAILRFNREVVVFGLMVVCVFATTGETPEIVDATKFTTIKIEGCDRTWTAAPDGAPPFVWTPSICLPERALNLPVGANDEIAVTFRSLLAGAFTGAPEAVKVVTSIIYRPIGGE